MSEKTIVDKAGFVVGFGIAAVSDMAAAVKTALVGAVVSSGEVSKADPVQENAPVQAVGKGSAKKAVAKKAAKTAPATAATAAVKKAPGRKAPAKKAPAKKPAAKAAPVEKVAAKAIKKSAGR